MPAFTVDRRESYYRRVAPHIAADSFGYQSRYTRGLAIQARLFPKSAPRPALVVPFRPRLAL